ncbi:MAG: hypothetical protein R3F62_17830 [Planctomycetota bacterium]
MLEAIPQVLIGVLGVGLWALCGAQLKSGEAYKLGQRSRETHVFRRDHEPVGYWFTQAALVVGGGAMVYAALFVDLPLR